MGSILGNRVQRVEDPRMLTIGGTYVEDVPVDAAWVHFVRSEYAHGRILSYDVDDARKMPGVLGVFTGDDLDAAAVPARAADPQTGQRTAADRQGNRAVRRRTDRRDRGSSIARTAVDAGALVYVDIEPLPAVVDLDDALSDADAGASATRHQHLRDVHIRPPGRLQWV